MIFSLLFGLIDELIHSLTSNLEIPCNLSNGLLPHPLTDEFLNIPIR